MGDYQLGPPCPIRPTFYFGEDSEGKRVMLDEDGATIDEGDLTELQRRALDTAKETDAALVRYFATHGDDE